MKVMLYGGPFDRQFFVVDAGLHYIRLPIPQPVDLDVRGGVGQSLSCPEIIYVPMRICFPNGRPGTYWLPENTPLEQALRMILGPEAKFHMLSESEFVLA